MNGSVAELNAQNGIPSTVAEHIAVAEKLGGLEVIGGPRTDNMYHSACMGWRLPFPLYKADCGRFRRDSDSHGDLLAQADQA